MSERRENESEPPAQDAGDEGNPPLGDESDADELTVGRGA